MPRQPPTDDTLPEALVDDRRRVSLVWLIPLVAVLASAWLGYRAYTQQGPLVIITFQTAEGLEAGKTRVRFKDVDVGVVESLGLTGDLTRVRVAARLAAHTAPHLNEETRFWVVRPRLSGGQVTGLGTLVGGTYIAVDFGREGESRRSFEGLETPPIVTATDPGSTFTLRADDLGSLAVGSPVQYRGIEVGRITGFSLREPHGVDIQVFVHAPHDTKVHAGTRFWNVSGMQVALDAGGIRLQTESLATMLLGGVAFGNPVDTAAGEPAASGTVFALFADRQAALERRYSRKQIWRLAFDGSVRGLLPGAPVEFRGIRIGEVVDLRIELEPSHLETRIPVTIAVEPGRLGLSDTHPNDNGLWDKLVADGLRAQLKTGNLITGALYVDLDFYPDAPAREIAWDGGTPELPTVPTPLDELRGVLTRLARLPLDSMGENLSASLAALHSTLDATNRLLLRIDRETLGELATTLEQTRRTLASAEKLLAPNSPLQGEAHRLLQELASAARSFRIMADYLERHPEALIRGKGAIAP